MILLTQTQSPPPGFVLASCPVPKVRIDAAGVEVFARPDAAGKFKYFVPEWVVRAIAFARNRYRATDDRIVELLGRASRDVRVREELQQAILHEQQRLPSKFRELLGVRTV